MDKFCSDIIRSEFSCSLPLQMLYGSGGFSAMGQEVLLMGSTMEEGVYGLIQAPEKTHRWTYQLSGSMQKRFNWQKLSIGMNASYSWMNSELLVEKAKKPYGLKVPCRCFHLAGTATITVLCRTVRYRVMRGLRRG